MDSILALPKHELASLLQNANDQYHIHGHPIFPDAVYDRIKEHFCQKWPSHPLCTQVGATPPSTKVILPCWMGSLDKVKNVSKWQERFPGPYIVSDKLDGLSALIAFQDGVPTRMYTRGDGSVGEDASFVMQYCSGIPEKCNPCVKLVRGELILPKSSAVKNARAIMVGAVNAKQNIREDVLSSAVFVAYELVSHDATIVITDPLDFLKQSKFDVVWHKHMSTISSDILSDILVARRKDSKFDIDGIVVTDVSKPHARATSGNPDHAFAYKNILTQEMAEVVVDAVHWEVSKDNYLIPTVIYQPVELNGVIMKKATGFNAKFIRDNVIGPGATILVVRSGDVIPHIFKVLTPAMSGKPAMPAQKYEWNNTDVDIVALEDTPELAIKRITFFFEKLSTRGVSEKTVKMIYDSGKATTIGDFLKLTVADLVSIPRFQDTLAKKVVSSIQSATSRASLLDIMVASNVFGRGLGEKKMKLIVDTFANIRLISTEHLMEIDGFAEKTAAQFVENVPTFLKFCKEIGYAFKTSSSVRSAAVIKDLEDMVVVFTGVRDKQVEEDIERRGGKVVSAMSKKVTHVVAKDPDQSTAKIAAAKEMGLQVMSLVNFLKLLQK